MDVGIYEWLGNVRTINYSYWTIWEAPEGLNAEEIVALNNDIPYIGDHIELYLIPTADMEDPMKEAMEGRVKSER